MRTLTLQAQSVVWCQVCSSHLTTEHCLDTWSCRRIPDGERLQIHQRVADQYRGFGPLSLAKRYAYQRWRQHSGKMTDFLLPTGMMLRISWYHPTWHIIGHFGDEKIPLRFSTLMGLPCRECCKTLLCCKCFTCHSSRELIYTSYMEDLGGITEVHMQNLISIGLGFYVISNRCTGRQNSIILMIIIARYE